MNFPEQIKQIIKDKPYTQDNIGMTNSQVLIFEDMVLKIEKRVEWKAKFNGYKTQDIVNVMNWLQQFNLAPKVLCFCQTQDFDYLLMSKIDGKMACDTYYLENSDLLLELIASTLKKTLVTRYKNLSPNNHFRKQTEPCNIFCRKQPC